MNVNEIAKRVADSIKKAEQSASGLEDGGTCNLDSVCLSVGADALIKRKNKKLEAAFTAVDVRFYSDSGKYTLVIRSGGQGYRRTRTVERVAQDLKDLGAFVNYVTD